MERLPNGGINLDQNKQTPFIEVTNYIAGRFVETDKFLSSYEPGTGKIWAMVQDSDTDDVEEAVQAAQNAFHAWSSLSLKERCRILLRLANLLEFNLDEFAVAESRDQGMTLSFAKKVNIPRAILNFRHFATTFQNILNTSTLQPEAGVLNYTVRNAVGVTGLISPWNLPLYLLTFKMAPALMAGNTIVCKPSELTSVTAWMLCKLFKDAGVPPGVINMVFGSGAKAGEPLVKHPDVSLISFTGSTTTGARILEKAAPDFKKVSLELGGKNAGIIFEDADVSKCVPETIRSAFTNQGEICLATSRLFVHHSIFDEFVGSFVDRTRELRVGPPLEDDLSLGALISEEHLTKVKNYVNVAVQENGQILCGYLVDDLHISENYQKGYYMMPTVISGLLDSSHCMQEEIFGPVVCISKFQDEAEVIKRVNNVKYGLCASVWTADSSRLHRVAHKLNVGTVWANCWLIRDLNMPFGGTKHSGIGREGTHDSYEFFTEVKTVCVKVDELAK